MAKDFVLPIVLSIILLGVNAASMIYMCNYIKKIEETLDIIGFIYFSKNKELYNEIMEENGNFNRIK